MILNASNSKYEPMIYNRDKPTVNKTEIMIDTLVKINPNSMAIANNISIFWKGVSFTIKS